MVVQIPERTEAVTVRLTPAEKNRLAEVALARDVRVGQLVRQILDRQLAPSDAEAHGDGRDGA